MSKLEMKTFSSTLARYVKSSVSLIVVAMWLSSCTVPITCVLYNNTSDSFVVTKIDLKGGEETFNLPPRSTVELSGWVLNDYKISYKNQVWRYDPSDPGVEYIEMTGFGPFIKQLVSAQLEQDGRIFLLMKGQNPPVTPLPGQPKGYPLKPMRLGSL